MKAAQRFFSVVGLVALTATLAMAAGSVFPDVDPNAYYAEAIGRASEKGLITGYGNKNFGPNDPVTRGQLAVILDRFETYLDNGQQPLVQTSEPKPTTDEGKETQSSAGANTATVAYKIGSSKDNISNSIADCKSSDFSGKSTILTINHTLETDYRGVDVRIFYGDRFQDFAESSSEIVFFSGETTKTASFDIGNGCFENIYVEILNGKTSELIKRMAIGNTKLPEFQNSNEITLNSGTVFVVDDVEVDSLNACNSASSKEKATVVFFDFMLNEPGVETIEFTISKDEKIVNQFTRVMSPKQVVREYANVSTGECVEGEFTIEARIKGQERVLESIKVKA